MEALDTSYQKKLQGHPPCVTWHYNFPDIFMPAERVASHGATPEFGLLYYQTANVNLKSIVCTVHNDWQYQDLPIASKPTGPMV